MLVSRGYDQSKTYTTVRCLNGILGFVPPKSGRKIGYVRVINKHVYCTLNIIKNSQLDILI